MSVHLGILPSALVDVGDAAVRRHVKTERSRAGEAVTFMIDYAALTSADPLLLALFVRECVSLTIEKGEAGDNFRSCLAPLSIVVDLLHRSLPAGMTYDGAVEVALFGYPATAVMTSVSSMLSLCSGLDDVGDVAALATQSLAVVDTYVLSALHGSISKERVTDVKATYAASTSIVDDARLSDDELDAFRRIVEDEA